MKVITILKRIFKWLVKVPPKDDWSKIDTTELWPANIIERKKFHERKKLENELSRTNKLGRNSVNDSSEPHGNPVE